MTKFVGSKIIIIPKNYNNSLGFSHHIKMYLKIKTCFCSGTTTSNSQGLFCSGVIPGGAQDTRCGAGSFMQWPYLLLYLWSLLFILKARFTLFCAVM